ncbi:MAG: hypothetical protein ACI977_000695, partial [Candidatus Nanohaloarchaea archaeon]
MNTKRAIIFLAAIFLLSTGVQATSHTDYNVEILTPPQSYTSVSPNSTTYQFVNLTYNGDPVDAENLETDNGEFFYEYPLSGTFNESMEHFNEGIWYTSIETEDSSELINYTLKNASEDSQRIWVEEQGAIDISEMNIEPVTDLESPIKANKEVTFRVDLLNTTSGDQISDADVEIRFVNGTYATELVNIGYNDGDNLYRTSLDTPDFTNQTFIGQITAEKGSYETSYSFEIKTKPAVEGHIDRIDAVNGGCDSAQMPEQCEGGAELETGFNVTNVPAQSVNVTLFKNSTEGDEFVYDEISLDRNNSISETEPGYYTGSLEFPYINQSENQDHVKLMYNASTDDREYVENYTIGYESFRANIDFERGYAYQNDQFSIPITLERYFSLNTLPEEEINRLEANITDSNGEQFATYNLSNVSLGTDEQYTETINIPGDAPVGDYTVEIFVEDIYRANHTVLRDFSVRENTQTFELSDSMLEPQFDRVGQYESTLTITDISGTGLNVSTEVSSELEDIVEIPDNFQMDPNEERELTLEWNISDLQSYTGNIEFTDEDSNYNTTVDVETQSPDCAFQDGDLCSITDREIEYTMDERTTEETQIEIRNIGPQGSTIDISTSVSGNISDYMGAPEELIFQDTQNVALNFTPEEQGQFTGTLTMDSDDGTLEYDIILNSEVPSGSPDADITSEVDLGAMVEGDSTEEEISIENVGETELTNISISSTDYDVESDTEGMTITPGNSNTVSISFNNVDTESGSLTVSLEALEESTETISVSADIYSDYSTRIDNLFEDIRSLRDETSSQEALSTLDEAERQLDSAEVSWQNGDYQEAADSYEEADEIYSSAQST